MIKLYWNTTSHDPISGFQWGKYHANNSNIWINLVLEKINKQNVQSLDQIKKDDILIIVDCDVDKKIEFYKKLRILCSKLYLINLGDESGQKNVIKNYDFFDHVWRSYINNNHKSISKITFLPAGYKSGIEKINNNSEKRNYKWAFIGTAHKASRQDLLYHFSKIKGGYVHQTKKFGDEKSMGSSEMGKIISSTHFIPCPNGFHHPETYRLYEALELGCIPIVESTYEYYKSIFPDHPFFTVEKWADGKKIVEECGDKQILNKRESCKKWWKEYKEKIQQSFFQIIEK